MICHFIINATICYDFYLSRAFRVRWNIIIYEESRDTRILNENVHVRNVYPLKKPYSCRSYRDEMRDDRVRLINNRKEKAGIKENAYYRERRAH